MRIFFCLPLLFVFLTSKAQTINDVGECDTIYTILDRMPEYKGGMDALYRELQKMKFVNACDENEYVRRIEWVVDKQGGIMDVHVLSCKDGCCDKIEKQFMTLTKWKPGKLKGKPVCVRMAMTIHIRQ